MTTIDKAITKTINSTFNINEKITLSPTDKKFGDYSTSAALRLAGKIGITPKEFYDKIYTNLLAIESVQLVEQVNGHINITVDSKYLAKEVASIINNKKYEITHSKSRLKTAIVELLSPNMAKPFSVGHLRSANQGWAAKRILEATGWNVITDNHIGDYGTPFGIWVVGYEKLSSIARLQNDGIYELGRIYVEMRKLIKEELLNSKTAISNQVQDWLSKLHKNDPRAIEYYNLFNKISLDHMHAVMSRLNISTDYEYSESSYVELANELLKKYIKNGVIIENHDGSAIANLKKYRIDTPILLRKSNGLPLYATTDMATLVFRKDKFNPDLVVYAVGNEQQFHFQQLFALAKLIGIKYGLYHLSYGLIEDIDNETGKRQKMSSRKGTVLLEELLDKAEERVKKLINFKSVNKSDIRKIAVGAIKFRDFAQDRKINYLFEWDTIFSLTGFAGPYIQYAIVRINKILNDKNYRTTSTLQDNYDYSLEKDILIKLFEYPNLLKSISKTFEFHRLAQYLYDLARLVNIYYEKVPVLREGVDVDDRYARLKFLSWVSQIMINGLDILGIEVPDNM